MARKISRTAGLAGVVVLVAAACTNTGGQATPGGPVTTANTTTSPASLAPASAAPASAAAAATVEAKAVGTAGTILVDPATGLTLYIFAKDVKDSGKSVCTGGCLETWPALTVPAGGTPVAGAGVTGTLATITREDNSELQVTYNGLPLYFFKNDTAPGDLKGVYENWETVAP